MWILWRDRHIARALRSFAKIVVSNLKAIFKEIYKKGVNNGVCVANRSRWCRWRSRA